MTHLALIYRITERDGTPVALRPGESVPVHADCLCHDCGFCNPAEIGKVVFPVFKRKAGRTSPHIARGRWTSANLLVERYDRDFVRPLGWVTYRHRDEDATKPLVAVTLGEWLDAHPGDRVVMWR